MTHHYELASSQEKKRLPQWVQASTLMERWNVGAEELASYIFQHELRAYDIQGCKWIIPDPASQTPQYKQHGYITHEKLVIYNNYAIDAQKSMLDALMKFDEEDVISFERQHPELLKDRPVLSSLEESQYMFINEGDTWRVRYQGIERTFKHKIGFSCVHFLLQRPREVIHVSDLYLTIKGKPSLSNSNPVSHDDDLSTGFELNVDKLEDSYRNEIKQKAIEIEKEFQKAIDEGDYDRAEKLEDDRESIKKQLNISFREYGGPMTQKPQKNVRKAITRCYESIEKELSELASHLRNSIRTGYQCSYEPKGDSIKWVT